MRQLMRCPNRVLNQHFRETRAAAAPNTNAAAAPAASTDINAEFLDALPPELRAEVLAQEAVERARQQRMQAATQAQDDAAPGDAGPAGNAVPGAPAGGMLELDPATFLATLDPELRQTVLLDQGEEMLGALPPDLLAE
jgi:E3 ubiquitin-protein ligase HUWE1